MIDFLWQNCGKIDGNSSDFPAKLRRIFRVSHAKRAQKLWENIIEKFEIKDGIISHKRVDKEMQKQVESRLRRQRAGEKGAEKRWKKDIEGDSNAIFSGMALDSSSTPTTSSSSTPTPKEDIELSCNNKGNSSDSLVLGLRIKELLEESFKPFNAREQSTFTNISAHLAGYAAGKSPMAFMGKLQGWVKSSKLPTIKKPKAMFVDIVKKETGFKKQDKIL